MSELKNTSSNSSPALGKNERCSATRKPVGRKTTTADISIIEKHLESFDCALISLHDPKLSEEESQKLDFVFGIRVLDKGYLDYRVKDNSKTKNNLIHLIVDSKNSRTLKENLVIWGREYNQDLVTFISKDKAYEILLSKQTEKEVSAYKKVKSCEKQIGKILHSNFKFEFSTISKTSGPTNNMGRWYFNSLLKSLKK